MEIGTARKITPAVIRAIIAEATGDPAILEHLGDDDNLFSDATALDSVDLVSVIVLTERYFGIDLSGEPDITALFRSIDSIVAAVETHRTKTNGD